jgi:transposase
VIFFAGFVRLGGMGVRRPNYAQVWLLPPSLDEWVPLGHPVRFVSDFVDAQDLSKLGIKEPTGEVGRPPVAADVLLKIWLYGFTQRIRSTRRLERACAEVMPFIWLTGMDKPDHNTIWRFFSGNHGAMKKVFKTLMQAAAAAELISFALHALDGTKLQAASSTDTALHRKALDERLKQLDAFIAQYIAQVQASAMSSDDAAGAQQMPSAMKDANARQQRIRELVEKLVEDREDGLLKAPPPRAAEPEAAQVRIAQAEPSAAPAPQASDAPSPQSDPTPEDEPAQQSAVAEVDPMLREATALKKEVEAKLAKLDAAGVNHLSELEPDARMMKGRGSSALGYNAQIVVDHESDLIVACDVSADQNDLKQLVPMLGQVQEQYGRVADETTADGGYNCGVQLARAEASAQPVIVKQREEPENAGAFDKSRFDYDAEHDVYICPRGEKLIQIGTSKSHATADEPDTIYRCNAKECPSRADCTKGAGGRQIRRPAGEDSRERQIEKQRDPRVMLMLGLRKEIVEHLFGIVKAVDGFRRFTVRGLEKVKAQWALVCLGVNLRKLAAMAKWHDGKLLPLAAAAAATG